MKLNEVICYPTDKSGRMSLDTPGSYIESIEPHLSPIEVTQEQNNIVEKNLNTHLTS